MSGFCESCKHFHIKAASFFLTFTKTEFAVFSEAVFDCYSMNISLVDIHTEYRFDGERQALILDLKSDSFSN